MKRDIDPPSSHPGGLVDFPNKYRPGLCMAFVPDHLAPLADLAAAAEALNLDPSADRKIAFFPN